MLLPKVTIVIPVFNQSAFLDRTILSVLNQSHSNIECIVVDDGSTDDSYLIAERHLPRLRILRQANAGQALAMNFGFAAAAGDFVGYLSADDVLDRDAVSVLIECMRSKDKDTYLVAFPEYRTIDQFDNVIIDGVDPFADVKDMVENFRCTIGPGAIFSKELIPLCGGWNSKFKQIPDFEFWLRVSANANFYQIPKILASFRVHLNSQTYGKSSIAQADESIYLVERVQSSQFKLPTDSNLRSFYSSAYIYSSCLHFKSARFALGVSRFAKSLTYSRKASLSRYAVRRLLSSIAASFTFYWKHTICR